MDEENKIQEAKTFKPEEPSELKEASVKKRKTDFYIEVVLFLILGILVGIAVKTEAAKRITVGFDDYKMKIVKQDYNLNEIEKNLAKKAAQDSQNTEGGSAPESVQPAN